MGTTAAATTTASTVQAQVLQEEHDDPDAIAAGAAAAAQEDDDDAPVMGQQPEQQQPENDDDDAVDACTYLSRSVLRQSASLCNLNNLSTSHHTSWLLAELPTILPSYAAELEEKPTTRDAEKFFYYLGSTNTISSPSRSRL